ncbi:uncharacterized protein METZ01_LOCUS420856, partial [marine metagenome]
MKNLSATDPDIADSICRFTHEFWEAKPRVVHAWLDSTNIAAGLAAVITGVPKIVLGCRNVGPARVGLNRSYMKPLYRLLSRRKNVLFTNNSKAGSDDYKKWLDLPNLSTRITPNGVNKFRDMDGLKSNKLRESLNISTAQGLIIGTIGRFANQKRPLLWIRVAEQLAVQRPDMRFLMVGEGPLLGQCIR